MFSPTWFMAGQLPASDDRQNVCQPSDALLFFPKLCPEGSPPFPYKLEGMTLRAIRLSGKTDKRIREAAERRGFSSATAFIRHVVEKEKELSGQRT